ncbi:nitroreductase [bacterium]|nr:nitroreductase [bacterium]
MNSVIENILTRRSIRNFKEEQIPKESLDLILKAATFAPSGMNSQSWHFSVIQNKNSLELLNKTVREVILNIPNENILPIFQSMKKFAESEKFNFFYNAPTFIIVSTDENSVSPIEDASIALQNIFLSAHSLNIGSCWIHALTILFDFPEIKKILKELGLPNGYKVCGSAALGYVGGNYPKAAARKENRITFHL